jgi:hypothetical protein
MGLDMYLSKRTYVKKWDHDEPETLHEVIVNRGGKPREDIDSSRISEVIEEVMYWRKANQIHKWFVDNVQDGVDDCKEYWVSEEKLQELLNLCEKVLESKNSDFLPPSDGFFFGGTEIDDYYYIEVADTFKTLTHELYLVKENKSSGDFYYQSSW